MAVLRFSRLAFASNLIWPMSSCSLAEIPAARWYRLDACIQSLAEPANLAIDAVPQRGERGEGHFLEAREGCSELLPKPASLVVDRGSHEVGFRPQNLACRFFRENACRLPGPDKKQDGEYGGNAGAHCADAQQQ